MPKTYNGIFDRIVSLDNLYDAYEDAKKGKRYKPETLETAWKAEETIHKIHKELKEGTWETDPFREFQARNEVKRRLVHAPSFRDRIVHHAIMRVVKNLFIEKFIFDSYGAIPGKGTQKAIKRVQFFLRRSSKNGTVYVLQGDIKSYYESIDKDILMEQIKRTIRDTRTLELFQKIINGYKPNGRGVPIGAYTSQLAANIYLNVLDHYVKECMMVKNYVRYMDDFVVVANSKKELWGNLADIKWLIEGTLHLTLNAKTEIYPASKGVDFAGYRTFTTHILPRKRNIKAAKIRFKHLSHQYKYFRTNLSDVKPRVASFIGYVKHCQANKTAKSTLKWLRLRRKWNVNNIKTRHGSYNSGQ